jgi:hypothetical protein
MEWEGNMIKAKLFKDKDNVSDKYYDVAERVENFINDNSIDDVISIVKIADTKREFFNGANLTYATELLLIYREGNE